MVAEAECICRDADWRAEIVAEAECICRGADWRAEIVAEAKCICRDADWRGGNGRGGGMYLSRRGLEGRKWSRRRNVFVAARTELRK